MVFAQSIKVRRMIEGIALDPKQTFWIMTVNLLADAAAIEWCKVFGSWDEDTHWTRVLPKEKHDEVRTALLDELGITQSEWEAYHGSSRTTILTQALRSTRTTTKQLWQRTSCSIS